MEAPHASGLDGVVAAETALSDVDGERGRLIIRGFPVEDLVERATFEDTCCLMWHGIWTFDERSRQKNDESKKIEDLPEAGTTRCKPSGERVAALFRSGDEPSPIPVSVS